MSRSFQKRTPAPMRMTSRPRVTMIGRSVEAPCSWRMTAHSTSAPSNGAPTTSTITSPTTSGTWCCCISQ